MLLFCCLNKNYINRFSWLTVACFCLLRTHKGVLLVRSGVLSCFVFYLMGGSDYTNYTI